MTCLQAACRLGRQCLELGMLRAQSPPLGRAVRGTDPLGQGHDQRRGGPGRRRGGAVEVVLGAGRCEEEAQEPRPSRRESRSCRKGNCAEMLRSDEPRMLHNMARRRPKGGRPHVSARRKGNRAVLSLSVGQAGSDAAKPSAGSAGAGALARARGVESQIVLCAERGSPTPAEAASEAFSPLQPGPLHLWLLLSVRLSNLVFTTRPPHRDIAGQGFAESQSRAQSPGWR